jgi:hypothetical protein
MYCIILQGEEVTCPSIYGLPALCGKELVLPLTAADKRREASPLSFILSINPLGISRLFNLLEILTYPQTHPNQVDEYHHVFFLLARPSVHVSVG